MLLEERQEVLIDRWILYLQGCPHAPVEVQASVTGSNCINVKVSQEVNKIQTL